MKRKQQLLLARQAKKGSQSPLPETSPTTSPPSSLLPSHGPSSSQLDDPPPSARIKSVLSGPSTSKSTSSFATPSTSAEPIEHNVVCSASKRKLGYNSDEPLDDQQTNSLPSTITDLETLRPLFANLLCPSCFTPSLSLENDRNKNSGLAISLVVRCVNCCEDLTSTMTSNKCGGSIYDVNRRAVAAASATGMGYSGLCNFSEIMNVPSLHHKTYAVHTKSISDKCEIFSNDRLATAVEKVKQQYSDQPSGIKDIHVSFDGSWHKRGHTSKSGIGMVIERRTGLIIDYEVLTSYCPLCATTGRKLENQNILKYERWLAGHKPFCSANYEGPSGGMEKEAALRIWSRSILKNGLRYVTMISDGDSKTISELHTLDPYPGTRVVKHECINHVGKRLGTALRNLVVEKSKAKPKVTLGGKGYGKLRPQVITQLQSYYTNAIRSHSTVPAMKKAVMAILDHCSSTDADPRHQNCPKGEDSWCFHQKAVARGFPPGSHEDNLGTPICQLVAENVRPTFERMSSDDLLSRCVLQTTQNANESAHAVIWARCPKHLFANRHRLNIAVALGVAEFNFGSASSQKFISMLDLPVGAETKRRGKKRDHTRTVKAEAAVTEKARRYRQLKAEAKQKEEQKLLDTYGQFYVSGGGD